MGCRELLLYNMEKEEIQSLGHFPFPKDIKDDWRCDLHPRWSPDGNYISIDSVHEGTRQIYVIDVRGIVDKV
jgi:hypothetical protein